MLDGIPLRRASRIVAHGDCDPVGIDEFLLQADLQHSRVRRVASTRVCVDQKALRMRVAPGSLFAPPFHDVVGSELGGVFRYSDTDKTAVRGEIVDSVGSRSVVRVAGKVVGIDLVRRPAPRPADILEVADQLLLLRVDTDDGVAGVQEVFALLSYVVELLVPVGVRRPGEALAVAPQRVAFFLEAAGPSRG